MSEIEIEVLIVETASKIFSRFGFSKTTMDEIAKHIHKAKGLLYYHFRSKEMLFNEVLRKELGEVKIELARIVESNVDSLSAFKEYMLTRLKLLQKAANYHETLKADFFEKFHFVIDVMEDFADFERNQLTNILKKGKKEGLFDFKNIGSTVNIIMMILHGIEIPFFLQHKYPEYESTIEELAILMVNSLKDQK